MEFESDELVVVAQACHALMHNEDYKRMHKECKDILSKIEKQLEQVRKEREIQ